MQRSSAAQAQSTLFVLAISIMCVVMQLIYPAESFHFSHSSFSTADLPNFTLVEEDSWYTGQSPFIADSVVWLTPDRRNGQRSNLGRFVYKDPIQFMNMNSTSHLPNKVASFNTSFSFQIITPRDSLLAGSGMAFFISHSEKAPNSSDGLGMGLAIDFNTTPTHFFAVEFDTWKSGEYAEEPSMSHIGIDINSMLSLKVIDTSPNSTSGFYPQLYLYSNYTFTTWIEYTSSKDLIQVWMTNSSQRPSQPCLELSQANLLSVFNDSMWVGFTARSASLEVHALHSWNFSIEDLNNSNTPGAASTSKSKLLVTLSVAISTLLALGVLGILCFCFLRRRRLSANRTIYLGSHNHNNMQLALKTTATPRYSYDQLRKAARGFTDENKIGEGGFSSVYKATLPDGSLMAIKKLKEGVRKEAEFSSEMNIISSIRHRNLLELKGWCYEKGEAMLVYKYMSNGSLESYLYGAKRGTLQSDARLKILAGVSFALDYLHSSLGECVLHRDVKAANVLLTNDFEALLGDFGLARLIGHDQGAVTMTAIGTPGYVAPEVVYAGKATDKADVYSFGVLALEIACGRRAMAPPTTQPNEVPLVDWVWLLHQGNQLMDALDPSMGMEPHQKEDWRCVLHVALMCCSPTPESRPSMRQVFRTLQGDTLLLRQPLPATRPLYPTSPNSWSCALASSSSETLTFS